MTRVKITGLLWLGLLAGQARADTNALPAALVSYREFIGQARHFCDLARTATWRKVYDQDFATNSPVDYVGVAGNGPAPGLSLTRADNRDALLITPDPKGNGNALVAVGGKLPGDFRIEMIAQSPTDKPCDLSLFAGAVDKSPGFQFGGDWNTKNSVWTDNANGVYQSVRLDSTTRITPRHWHTVRMELVAGEVRGFVDGKLIGTGKRGAKHNRATPRQPMIYCFSSPILVDRVLVEHFDPDYLNRTATNLWRQAFGALSPAEVDAKLAGLIALLDHERHPVREAAQFQLSRLRPLAEPQLRAACTNDSPELRLRARELLDWP